MGKSDDIILETRFSVVVCCLNGEEVLVWLGGAAGAIGDADLDREPDKSAGGGGGGTGGGEGDEDVEGCMEEMSDERCRRLSTGGRGTCWGGGGSLIGRLLEGRGFFFASEKYLEGTLTYSGSSDKEDMLLIEKRKIFKYLIN